MGLEGSKQINILILENYLNLSDMKRLHILIIVLFIAAACNKSGNQKTDWLIDDAGYKAVTEEKNRNNQPLQPEAKAIV